MAETIPIPDDLDDDFQDWNDHAELGGHKYDKVDTPEILVEDRRWASIRRIIWARDDGTFWAFDYEHSNTETHEAWSYIEPELKLMVRQEITTVVWTVAG